MTRSLRLAHSPDADDAFMFYALAEGKIETGDRRYIHELADIETLNQRALRGELDITAVSFHAYAYLADAYALLPSGGSVGDGYGPRLVGRRPPPAEVPTALRGQRIAIPGRLTTAALTLRLCQPDFESVIAPFDQIEDRVVAGDVDLGLLIHEGQLTYRARGLHLWLDLGAWWRTETALPLPLGGNVVKRALGETVIQGVARDLQASIAYGLAHRAQALEHALRYARGLEVPQADEFVGMYVNDFTLDYGDRGRRAVEELLARAAAAGVVPTPVRPVFVDLTAA